MARARAGARVEVAGFDPTPVLLHPARGQVVDAPRGLWPRGCGWLVADADHAGVARRVSLSWALEPRRTGEAVAVMTVCARLAGAGWRAWASWRAGGFVAAQLWREGEDGVTALGVAALRAWVKSGDAR